MLHHAQAPAWSGLHRLLFRFACIYFTSYCLLPEVATLPGVRAAQQGLVAWVGRTIFHVDILFRPSGSGDTTGEYITVFVVLVAALVGTLLWTLLDHRRQYQRLHVWFRLLVRYALFSAMVGYGVVKIVNVQFPHPSLVRLLQPFGDASPMGLLWMFMGASAPYTMFTGLAELLGGVLLVSRRTTVLGALICAAALSHVLMLNLSYDVPVKLYSAHLLALALVLIVPDLPRLFNFFIRNRPTLPAPMPQLISRPRAHRVGLVLRSVLAGVFVTSALFGTYRSYLLGPALAPRPALYGVWAVEQFALAGVEQPPLLTDTQRWHRLIVDTGGRTTVQRMDATFDFYRMTDTAAGQQVTLVRTGDAATPSLTFRYDQPAPGTLVLHGTLAGQPVAMTLVQQDEFLLTSRSFHWITEQPYNR